MLHVARQEVVRCATCQGGAWGTGKPTNASPLKPVHLAQQTQQLLGHRCTVAASAAQAVEGFRRKNPKSDKFEASGSSTHLRGFDSQMMDPDGLTELCTGARVSPHRMVVSRRHHDRQEVSISQCGPAGAAAAAVSQRCCRFGNGLGMHVVGKSDQATGNTTFASYVLRSHDMVR